MRAWSPLPSRLSVETSPRGVASGRHLKLQLSARSVARRVGKIECQPISISPSLVTRSRSGDDERRSLVSPARSRARPLRGLARSGAPERPREVLRPPHAHDAGACRPARSLPGGGGGRARGGRGRGRAAAAHRAAALAEQGGWAPPATHWPPCARCTPWRWAPGGRCHRGGRSRRHGQDAAVPRAGGSGAGRWQRLRGAGALRRQRALLPARAARAAVADARLTWRAGGRSRGARSARVRRAAGELGGVRALPADSRDGDAPAACLAHCGRLYRRARPRALWARQADAAAGRARGAGWA